MPLNSFPLTYSRLLKLLPQNLHGLHLNDNDLWVTWILFARVSKLRDTWQNILVNVFQIKILRPNYKSNLPKKDQLPPNLDRAHLKMQILKLRIDKSKKDC